MCIPWTEKSNDLQIHNHTAARDPDSLRNFKDYLRSYKELKKIHWYTCKEDPTKNHCKDFSIKRTFPGNNAIIFVRIRLLPQGYIKGNLKKFLTKKETLN